MNAIETRYKGYRFRSRLEARFAVFMATLGVKWEYEKEGYALASDASTSAIWYLPDFWLPELDCFIEIKGEEPTMDEQDLCGMLAMASSKRVFCFFGEIGSFREPGHQSAYMFEPFDSRVMDMCYAWCVCPDCGAIGIQFEGRSDRLSCKMAGCPRHSRNGDRHHTGDSARIVAAIAIARAARFEHGERGAPKFLEAFTR